MPADLAQQVPYIRRALEAYRIPILELPGFEADDVIGTLAHKAAGEGYSVFVVSSDKDMMQLVTDRICVLNPPKDNLICDAAKVEEILGVPPERVVDVMALRGDSIDNIPGAPGIGDKGSVELIQRFGSVEAALDHAAEVERKTYRESLQNNRDAILVSKQLVTIDTNVAVEFDPESMRAQEPDAAAARALFTELEFTTLVQDFLTESIELGETDYREAKSAADVEAVIAAAKKPGRHAGDRAGIARPTQPAGRRRRRDSRRCRQRAAFADAERAAGGHCKPRSHRVAISAEAGKALTVALDDQKLAAPLKQALADESLPKTVHDYKSAMHVFARAGHRARRCAARSAALRLSAGSDVFHLWPARVVALSQVQPEAWAVARRSCRHHAAPDARSCASEVEQAGLRKVYDEIDLPLVAGAGAHGRSRRQARLRRAGRDVAAAGARHQPPRLARSTTSAGFEFNINSPKQLGDVLFNKLNLPKPIKYGKGKTISTAVDVLEGLAAEHEVPKHGAGLPPALEAEVDVR